MIKAVAVHCHGDTPNEINSSGLAESRRLNNKLSRSPIRGRPPESTGSAECAVTAAERGQTAPGRVRVRHSGQPAHQPLPRAQSAVMADP
jgi:hypothetical protein